MRLFHATGIMWLGLLTAASLLPGCAVTGDGSEARSGQIRITSEPVGAVAYADGAELGATPLAIAPGEHFHPGFAGFSYRYIGKLSIKKPGCETWSTEVNDAILARDIHAQLKCDPNFKPAAVQPGNAAPNTGATSEAQPIERLERIEGLHKKGLINEEEYRQLRKRVLENL